MNTHTHTYAPHIHILSCTDNHMHTLYTTSCIHTTYTIHCTTHIHTYHRDIHHKPSILHPHTTRPFNIHPTHYISHHTHTQPNDIIAFLVHLSEIYDIYTIYTFSEYVLLIHRTLQRVHMTKNKIGLNLEHTIFFYKISGQN
jgi:hypothetical protein